MNERKFREKKPCEWIGAREAGGSVNEENRVVPVVPSAWFGSRLGRAEIVFTVDVRLRAC